MDIVKKISTPMAEVELREDGLYYLEITTNDTTIEIAKEHIRMMREEFDVGPHNLISTVVTIRNLKAGSGGNKEVRDFFAKPKNSNYLKASAFIITSPILKIGANLFMKFSKPPYPNKAFSNIEKAREWLFSLN